jgi:hypothetical protein
VHVQEEKAKRLAKTLSEPVSNSALVMLMNRRKPEMQFVRGFALLEGQDELWMMQPSGEHGKEIVEFAPSNMSAIKERFFEMLP